MEVCNMKSNVEYLEYETTCSICFAEFLDINDLHIHITQVHYNEARMNRYCSACCCFFKDVEEYALHLKTYHLKSLRWCKYCTRMFFNKEDLKKHEKRHGEWKYKSCLHCDKTFLFTDILAAHEFKNHYSHKNSNEGIMLQNIFPILSAILHMNVKKFFTVQYTHESYKCISCSFTTSDVDQFLQHVETEDKKSFVCNTCCRVFPSKKKLRCHVKGKCNRNVEWSECGVCEKKIESASLETHTQQCVRHKYVSEDIDMTPKAIPLLKCKFCRKMFVGNVAHNKHIEKIHKPNFHLYKYKCIMCDIPFLHPKYLFAHYFSSHKDIQPYTCKICNKTYRVRKSFTLHIKLDHKSVGFVEFDEEYKVYFTDKKSEDPFQPYPILTEYLAENKESKNNLTLENSDFINGTETECETDADRSQNNVSLTQTERVEIDCETDIETGQITVVTHKEKMAGVHSNTQNENTAYIHIERETNIHKKGNKQVFKHRTKQETESETDIDNRINKVKCKKNTVLKKRNKNKQNYKSEVSSNDSDVPLSEMTKRNMEVLNKRRKKNKFVCLKCNKNCYTYQNYNHHMSLHVGCKLKKCIKCQKTFKSKMALEEHMKRKHTSSKLTETLKQVLQRRKHGLSDSIDPQTLRQNFKKTINKVNIPKDQTTPAVLKLIDNGLSAKSFIESFVPEETSKEIKVTSSITIKELKGGYKPPFIKMTKFKPEPSPVSYKLQMPVKFKPENTSHVKANMKIIQKPMFTISKPLLPSTTSAEEIHDSMFKAYDIDVFIDDKEEIPDVAEEVMLNSEEKEEFKEVKIINSQNSIVIPNVADNYEDLKIAHLQPQAPYYKIVSMKDIVKKSELQKPQPAPSPGPVNVTLSDGMKLVSVNPLAHLLKNTNVEKIIKPNKHYVAKVRDIKTAMEKAMQNVYQPKKRRKIS